MHSRHSGARAGRSAHLGAPEEARQKGLPDAHGPYAAGQVVCRGVGARASAPANWVMTYERAPCQNMCRSGAAGQAQLARAVSARTKFCGRERP